MALPPQGIEQWSLTDHQAAASQTIQYLDERSGTLLEAPAQQSGPSLVTISESSETLLQESVVRQCETLLEVTSAHSAALLEAPNTEEHHIQILCSNSIQQLQSPPDHPSLTGGVSADSVTPLPVQNRQQESHLSQISKARIDTDSKPFPCDECDASYSDRLSLAKHERTHNAGGGGHCPVCDRWLSSSLHLTRHKRMHRLQQRRKTPSVRKEGPYPSGRRSLRRRGRGPTRCGCCGEFFSGRALHEHFAPHPRTGFYPCVSCGGAFAQACQLDRHFCVELPPEPESPPPPPPPSTATRGSARLRKTAAVQPKPEPVEESAEDSATVSDSAVKEEVFEESTPVLEPVLVIESHSEQEDMDAEDDSPPPSTGMDDGTGSQQLECNLCDRKFTSARNLRRHARTHSNGRRLACEVCERVYSRLDSLVRHSIEAHDQQRVLPCPRCRWRFTQQRILDYHLELHDAGAIKERHPAPRRHKPRRFRCGDCRRGFSTEAELASHECPGASSTIYVCDICGKAIKTKDWLSRHRLLHESKRPAKCDVCDRAFIDDKALQKHLKTHTDGRRFLCDVCGKGFTLKVTLQIHSRTHTGEKPFVCSVCAKPFTTRTQLYHHSKIHSGEKPYVCPVCGRAFRQSHHLKTHMRIHPGEHSLPVKAETPPLQPAVGLNTASHNVLGSEIPMVVHPALPAPSPVVLSRHKLQEEVYTGVEHVQEVVTMNGDILDVYTR